jgi:hypothetical protein
MIHLVQRPGRAIVCSPSTPTTVSGTDMDVLVLENHILLKHEQPTSAIPARRVPGVALD